MAAKRTRLIVKFLIFFGIVLSWASSAEARITLGVAPATDSMIVSEDRGRSFRAYLEERLGEPVVLRVFEDEKILHDWVHRFRVVDLALLSRAYIGRQPAGQFHILADVVATEGPSAEQLLMRQGAKPRALQKVREVILAMGEDPAGQKLLADFGVSRLAVPSGPAVAAPAVAHKTRPTPPPVKKERAVVMKTVPAAKKARPAVKKKIPTSTPPLTKKFAPPKPVVKEGAPAAGPLPVGLLVGKDAPAPAVAPVARPAAAPVARPAVAPVARPAVAPVARPAVAPVARPVGEQVAKLAPKPAAVPPSIAAADKTAYVVPFVTIMVPDPVAEGIFDRFIDILNDSVAGTKYDFEILKGGLARADESWRSSHSYVTGEIFGYVEDSGCCSTEIRFRTRIALHRPEETGREFELEIPAKSFFEHDYSTLEVERQKLVEGIASELAARLLAEITPP